jgi:cytidylate kinase
VVYRAITVASVVRGIDPSDEDGLVALVPRISLGADEQGNLRNAYLDGEDVTERLHSPEVDRRVSAVSAKPRVRAALLSRQREVAAAGDVILAGRDIGTVVLPDADLKLWLEASAEERARRRAAQRGHEPGSDEERTILADLQRRDHLDSSRAVAPLRRADDAVIVTSDGRDFEETIADVVRLIERRAAEGSEA